MASDPADRTRVVARGTPALDGEMLIRASVHARLLGLKILTLDASVVVGPNAGRLAAAEPPVPGRTASRRAAVALEPPPPGPSTPVAGTLRIADAVDLLAAGAETLAQARHGTASRLG